MSTAAAKAARLRLRRRPASRHAGSSSTSTSASSLGSVSMSVSASSSTAASGSSRVSAMAQISAAVLAILDKQRLSSSRMWRHAWQLADGSQQSALRNPVGTLYPSTSTFVRPTRKGDRTLSRSRLEVCPAAADSISALKPMKHSGIFPRTYALFPAAAFRRQSFRSFEAKASRHLSQIECQPSLGFLSLVPRCLAGSPVSSMVRRFPGGRGRGRTSLSVMFASAASTRVCCCFVTTVNEPNKPAC